MPSVKDSKNKGEAFATANAVAPVGVPFSFGYGGFYPTDQNMGRQRQNRNGSELCDKANCDHIDCVGFAASKKSKPTCRVPI